MQRVGEFEKVSYDQFYKDMKDEFYSVVYNEEFVKEKVDAAYSAVAVPKRATSGSAGYDLIAPFDIYLAPGESVKIPTGIRVLIECGWFLMCVPRSGLGFKYQVRMANTCGIIDEDYSHSDNEGHIFCKLVNGGSRIVNIKTGEAFAQAIFIPYGITYVDDVKNVRNGGLGSTNS